MRPLDNAIPIFYLKLAAIQVFLLIVKYYVKEFLMPKDYSVVFFLFLTLQLHTVSAGPHTPILLKKYTKKGIALGKIGVGLSGTALSAIGLMGACAYALAYDESTESTQTCYSCGQTYAGKCLECAEANITFFDRSFLWIIGND